MWKPLKQLPLTFSLRLLFCTFVIVALLLVPVTNVYQTYRDALTLTYVVRLTSTSTVKWDGDLYSVSNMRHQFTSAIETARSNGFTSVRLIIERYDDTQDVDCDALASVAEEVGFAAIGHEELDHPHSVAVQFQYGFVTDKHGVKVLDTTDLGHPHVIHEVELEDAHGIYVARTYAYVAAGKNGLMILDIENPHQAQILQQYTANGKINDAHDVQLGITNVSQFAYVADGKNGLRVIQLTGPEVPGNDGFSPKPEPFLVATYKLPKEGHALAISRGMDRDRAVDESGNQIAVFGRVGARPLNKDEASKLYRRPDGTPWHVSDNIFDPQVYEFQQ